MNIKLFKIIRSIGGAISLYIIIEGLKYRSFFMWYGITFLIIESIASMILLGLEPKTEEKIDSKKSLIFDPADLKRE